MKGGFIAWEGPSTFDGAPLVVIVTQGSKNRKTGAMDQAWILRADVHPYHAVRTGADASICGTCRHRGNGQPGSRSCYVTVQHGPAGVYRAYRAGRYPHLTPKEQGQRLAGRFLRLGAYGDPYAAPVGLWRRLTAAAAGWTGYTHFAHLAHPDLKKLLMASCDTESERAAALKRGWRTFRVRQGGKLLPGEVVCPASEEAGKATTCQKCRICSAAAGQSA